MRVQFDRFAKGFWRVLGQSSIERVVEAEELRVMVQGDEAPLDWAALQDVCAYEGFGEAVGGADEAATPPVNDDMSADVEGSSDSDASDSSGEPLFGAVTEPRVVDNAGDAPTPDGGAEAAAARRAAPRNPRDVPVVKALWAAVAALTTRCSGLPHVRHGVQDGAHGRFGALRRRRTRPSRFKERAPTRTRHHDTLLQTAAAGVRPSTKVASSWSML